MPARKLNRSVLPLPPPLPRLDTSRIFLRVTPPKGSTRPTMLPIQRPCTHALHRREEQRQSGRKERERCVDIRGGGGEGERGGWGEQPYTRASAGGAASSSRVLGLVVDVRSLARLVPRTFRSNGPLLSAEF